MVCGERGRNRTYNLLIKSQLLCQLSYAPAFEVGWKLAQLKLRQEPIIPSRGGMSRCVFRRLLRQPRQAIARFAEVVDPRRARERSFCCGAGGGQMFLGEEKGKRINVERAQELVAMGAHTIATACPFCQSMFRDALGALAEAPPKLLDIAQIAAAALPEERPKNAS